MMDALANPMRGEASCRVGSTDLILVVEFARLATLCDLTDCNSASLLYERLLGFHFKTVIAAIRVLTIHPDGDAAARELARKAVSELSAADEPAFRAAIEKALEGHISAGRILRDEHDHLGDIERVLEKSAAGKRKRPSKSRT